MLLSPPFPPSSVILTYAGTIAFDSSCVTVIDDESLLLSTPYLLLSLNTQLLHPLLALLPQPASKHKAFKISEFTVVLLHLLSALHDHLLQYPGSSLVVTMLTQLALRKEVDRRERAAGSRGKVSSAAEPQPLLFSAKSQDSPIRLRWCSSWSDATHHAVSPARVVFLPSLMWLREECTVERAQHHIDAMLSEIGASLWPPTSWEGALEHKDKIYSQFNKFMLPARWVTLAAVQGSVERLATSLLGFCSQQGRGDGRYFIKGSFSFAKACGRSIVVAGGQCAELVDVLRDFVSSQHQHCAGIQSFIPGFDKCELRTWLVPDPVTLRWRHVLTIKTQIAMEGAVWAEQFQPMHGPGLRVAALIDNMLEERAPFFEELRRLGLPALRIDCGFDEATQRPFFNEFSACEAYMWSELHGQDLAYVVGRSLGDGMWTQLSKAR